VRFAWAGSAGDSVWRRVLFGRRVVVSAFRSFGPCGVAGPSRRGSVGHRFVDAAPV